MSSWQFIAALVSSCSVAASHLRSMATEGGGFDESYQKTRVSAQQQARLSDNQDRVGARLDHLRGAPAGRREPYRIGCATARGSWIWRRDDQVAAAGDRGEP